MKAIRIHAHGGPEVLRLEEIGELEPKPTEALVKIHAIGVNFTDVYQRSGANKVPSLPFTPGVEASGEIVRLDSTASTSFKIGDRVAWIMIPGAYAESAVVPVERLIPVHDSLSHSQVASALLQGITAQYLSTSTFKIEPGQYVLIHAVAGGLGLLLTQMAKRRGAYVIGTTSTPEKAELARKFGCDSVAHYDNGFVAEVKKFTKGAGCDVVYDSIGKTTFLQSLDCLKVRGMMVLNGQSSGAVPPIDPGILGPKGGLFLTRPSVNHYTVTREELLARAQEVQQMLVNNTLQVHIDRSLPLAEASKAHAELEGRRTKGKVILLPS